MDSLTEKLKQIEQVRHNVMEANERYFNNYLVTNDIRDFMMMRKSFDKILELEHD